MITLKTESTVHQTQTKVPLGSHIVYQRLIETMKKPTNKVNLSKDYRHTHAHTCVISNSVCFF